ncbi:hypothetical protein [Kocuria sp.]|uniref:hypothetical protein n=1 Tax=Kocuria sp. TaxID=1871328 RepID=UPI003F8D2764
MNTHLNQDFQTVEFQQGHKAAPAGTPSPVALDDPDRGDVPGWVMLTLMSAVLVAGLLLIAQPALEGLFNDAISRVTGQ